MEFYGIHLTTILQAAHEISLHGTSLKITILKLRPQLPGANELRQTTIKHELTARGVTETEWLSWWLHWSSLETLKQALWTKVSEGIGVNMPYIYGLEQERLNCSANAL